MKKVRYYVTSDIHGFYTELMAALTEKGYFEDTEPHKLIVCGDLMDRGKEAVAVQKFMTELLEKEELILIRGNHETLFLDMMEEFQVNYTPILQGYSHHVTNGTFDTALQLTRFEERQAFRYAVPFCKRVFETDFYQKLIPASMDYFETEHYIFVHGWIPCKAEKNPLSYKQRYRFAYEPDWRAADSAGWNQARWVNGIELAERYHITETGKRIVCGHWHAAYGHCKFETGGDEFAEGADNTPYYGNGIIAIDARTAHSHFVNCIVIED